jgi:D-serine deaminase-like pyridoxal phosphate-dependent protein
MPDVFVANTIAGVAKIRALAECARVATAHLAVDDAANARDISAAASDARSEIGILIEVDTGMDRAGVDTARAALDLARQVVGLPGLRFEGLTGYEGHCSLTPERDLRLAKQRAAMHFLVEVADLLIADGTACPILSAGGTATWDWTAANPRVTDIQAGTYVVMDNSHAAMVKGFEHSLTVRTAVISRPPTRVIVDAGSKSLGDGELSSIVGYDLPIVRYDEEHGVFATPGPSPLMVGDVVALVPGNSSSTVNLYDAYHVIQDGAVVDIWPVVPRGPGHNGLLQF